MATIRVSITDKDGVVLSMFEIQDDFEPSENALSNRVEEVLDNRFELRY